MQIIRISQGNPDSKIIQKAVKIMRAGGTVVYPTDTAYGLGCDFKNKRALARIFKIKQRPAEKSLPVIAGSVAMVKKLYRVDALSARLIKKYWPGPLTLVLGVRGQGIGARHKRTKLIPNPYSLSPNMAVRVPDCKIACLLSLKLGRPIVSTSANISGKPVCYSIKSVLRQFGFVITRLFLRHNLVMTRLPDLILDAGSLPRRRPSTIVEIKNKNIIVLRKGAINVFNHQ